MSVYVNDVADQLKQAVESCFENQKIKPEELILVEDGPLTEELYSTITYLKNKFNVIKSVVLPENQGLGNALKIGIQECSHEIVARMDSDDINAPDRFYYQIDKIKENDVVGMFIEEFYEEVHDKNFIKRVPIECDEIKKYILRRNPINHMTVMFKKSKVIEAGNYQTLMYVEDYYLWIRMLSQDAKIINIPIVGVYARTGLNMYSRRSNIKTIESWKVLQEFMLNRGWITKFEMWINMIAIRFFTLTPVKIKEKLYKFIFRKR